MNLFFEIFFFIYFYISTLIFFIIAIKLGNILFLILGITLYIFSFIYCKYIFNITFISALIIMLLLLLNIFISFAFTYMKIGKFIFIMLLLLLTECGTIVFLWISYKVLKTKEPIYYIKNHNECDNNEKKEEYGLDLSKWYNI